MNSIHHNGAAARSTPETLKQYQTVASNRFKIADLTSGGLFKPCRLRNAKFLLRSTFSWGARHARIVLEHRTSRVDRRMAKLLNALGTSANTNQIDKHWQQLQIACTRLWNLRSEPGYLNLRRAMSSEKTFVERVDLNPKEQLLQAFRFQLRNFRPAGCDSTVQESGQQYLVKVMRLLDLITSANITPCVLNDRSDGLGFYSVGDLVREMVKVTADDIAGKLGALTGDGSAAKTGKMGMKLNAGEIAWLKRCVARLQEFHGQIKSAPDCKSIKLLATSVAEAIKALNGTLLEQSAELILRANSNLPDHSSDVQVALEVLADVERRQGRAEFDVCMEKIFAEGFRQLGDQKQALLLNRVVCASKAVQEMARVQLKKPIYESITNAEPNDEESSSDSVVASRSADNDALTQRKSAGATAAAISDVDTKAFLDHFKEGFAKLYAAGSLDIQDLDNLGVDELLKVANALKKSGISPYILKEVNTKHKHKAEQYIQKMYADLYNTNCDEDIPNAFNEIDVALGDFCRMHSVSPEYISEVKSTLQRSDPMQRAEKSAALKQQRDARQAKALKKLMKLDDEEFIDKLTESRQTQLSKTDRALMNKAVTDRLTIAIEKLLDLALLKTRPENCVHLSTFRQVVSIHGVWKLYMEEFGDPVTILIRQIINGSIDQRIANNSLDVVKIKAWVEAYRYSGGIPFQDDLFESPEEILSIAEERSKTLRSSRKGR